MYIISVAIYIKSSIKKNRVFIIYEFSVHEINDSRGIYILRCICDLFFMIILDIVLFFKITKYKLQKIFINHWGFPKSNSTEQISPCKFNEN